MLDCISGGRLVAGLPLGSPMDGQPRLRHHADGATASANTARRSTMVLKAWQAKEIFAWNGKYFQLGQVNLWPRAHPGAAPAGVGARIGQHQHLRLRHRPQRCYCFLSYAGRARGLHT